MAESKSGSAQPKSGSAEPKSGPTFDVDADQVVVRVRELSEQVIEKSKESGLAWLQAYENMLESMLKLQQQAAASTQVEWVTTVANTSADFVREFSRVYLDAVKSQLSS